MKGFFISLSSFAAGIFVATIWFRHAGDNLPKPSLQSIDEHLTPPAQAENRRQRSGQNPTDLPEQINKETPPTTLSIVDASRLENVRLFQDDFSPEVSTEFSQIFNLTTAQTSGLRQAFKTMFEQLSRVELSKLQNLKRENGVVTFEIPRFEAEGSEIKRELMQNLEKTLPQAAFEYITLKEEKLLRYATGDFGKFKRGYKIEIVDVTSKDNRWLLTESNFTRAAQWAIDEGRPPEMLNGTRLHRFTTLPERFSNLLTLE